MKQPVPNEPGTGGGGRRKGNWREERKQIALPIHCLLQIAIPLVTQVMSEEYEKRGMGEERGE
jgi:hypothetical protein